VVKVTLTDRAKTTWSVAYVDGQGTVRHSDPVSLAGDGTRKTVTLQLPELAATGSLPPGEAFQDWQKGLPEPTNQVRNGDFSAGDEGWQGDELYRVIPDPDNAGAKCVQFTYERKDDTVHMDQTVELQAGVQYRLGVQIRNDGNGLKPGVRVGRMDWSTVLYVEGAKQGEWEAVSGVFTPDKTGPYRLQLFGQGRGNHAAGLSGMSFFRGLSVVPLTGEEVAGSYRADLRIEVSGPGDLTASFVRVIHPDAAERTRRQPER
jgi:hypothetical protein